MAWFVENTKPEPTICATHIYIRSFWHCLWEYVFCLYYKIAAINLFLDNENTITTNTTSFSVISGKSPGIIYRDLSLQYLLLVFYIYNLSFKYTEQNTIDRNSDTYINYFTWFEYVI